MTRIYILFADEPVFHPPILEAIAASRPGEIVGVGGVGHRLAKQQLSAYYRKQLDFWGPRGFLVNTLAVTSRKVAESLPLPERLTGTHSLQGVCSKHKIGYEPVENVNDPTYVARLRRLEPDVIVCSQGQIFGRELLALPKIACINRHSSLLPKYGGLKPVFWAMLNGEEEVGVSVHVMGPEIDRGDVLAQIRVPAPRGKTMYQLYKELFGISATAVLHALAVLEGTQTPPQPDSAAIPSYFLEPDAQDVRRFRDLGYRLA